MKKNISMNEMTGSPEKFGAKEQESGSQACLFCEHMVEPVCLKAPAQNVSYLI